MNKSNPSYTSVPQERQARRHMVRRLLYRYKMPVLVSLMAALVGTLVGLVGVLFEKAVNGVQAWGLAALAVLPQHTWLLILAAFVLSALLTMIGYYLVRRYAPEAGGSGIPEIEGALEELRPVRWWRVIPVKFIGGMGALGAGMVLGREGPTVQLGGNLGRMVLDVCRLRGAEARHTLLATGAASGLTAAFNAPLAGILFIVEEMRPQFRYNLLSIEAVFIGVIMASIVFRLFNGERAVIAVGKLAFAPVNTLWLYLLLGAFLARWESCSTPARRRLAQDHRHWRSAGGRLRRSGTGRSVCRRWWFQPDPAGRSRTLYVRHADIHLSHAHAYHALVLLFMRARRHFRANAGVRHPAVYGFRRGRHDVISPGRPAGRHVCHRRFAASVRAPLTGIVLVLEMTDNYRLILPMIITCLGATLVAQFLGGKPLYSSLLARTLQRLGQDKDAWQAHIAANAISPMCNT